MPVNSKPLLVLAFFGAMLFALPLAGGPRAAAQTARVNELQAQISNHSQQIAELEKEIAAYQKNLSDTAAQAKTLQGELTVLETERKKLATEINLTENKIGQTNLNIKRLTLEIGDKDEIIADHQAALRASLRDLRAADQESLVEAMLGPDSFSAFVVNQARLADLQGSVNNQIADLRTLKAELTGQKEATEAERRKLSALNIKLADQKKIADQNQKEKNALLSATKSTEANYKKILAERQAKKEAFERELYELESQLKIAIDPSLLPARGSSVLAWPLDNVYITQYFGKTVDSVRLYASGTHNGIDFRASVGTPIKAAASGVVTATGNTDLQPGCYSYGQWVLVKHNNGLSTLYAHLSLIKVTAGQAVATGQLLGYSGRTGYATGPHLHLTVYATQGVQIKRYENSINCKNVTIPIADPKAYLNPLDYLPRI